MMRRIDFFFRQEEREEPKKEEEQRVVLMMTLRSPSLPFRACVAVLVAVFAAACLLMMASAGARSAEAQQQPAEEEDTAQAEDAQGTAEAEDEESTQQAEAQVGEPVLYYRQIVGQLQSEDLEGTYPRDPGDIYVYKAVIACPPGYVATGGGWDVNNTPFEGKVGSSRPVVKDATTREKDLRTGSGWYVSAYTFQEKGTFTIFNVCVREDLLPGINYQGLSSQAPYIEEVPIRSNHVGEKHSYCKGDDVAIGGGLELQRNVNTGSPAGGRSEPVRSQPALNNPKAWISAARVMGSWTNGDHYDYLGTVVVCVPQGTTSWPHREYKVNTGSRGVPTNTPPCPSGQSLLGGGFGVPDGKAGDLNWAQTKWRSNWPNAQSQIWSTGIYSPFSIDLWAYAMCARLKAQGSLQPKIVDTKPADGKSGVWRLANVRATFSEAMDATTLDESSFTLVKQGTSTPIPAKVTLSEDGGTAKLDPYPDDPTQKLGERKTYTAKISGAKDLEGNVVPDKQWSFTTEGR